MYSYAIRLLSIIIRYLALPLEEITASRLSYVSYLKPDKEVLSFKIFRNLGRAVALKRRFRICRSNAAHFVDCTVYSAVTLHRIVLPYFCYSSLFLKRTWKFPSVY